MKGRTDMNKKWLMIFTSSILAAFLLAGCADDQDPAPPGTDDGGMDTEEPAGDEGLGTDEMAPDDEMTPGDETTPGTTEEGEGTPGEQPEGTTENPEENMGEGTNGGNGTNGEGNGTGIGEEEDENK
jgi:hypothetical protein